MFTRQLYYQYPLQESLYASFCIMVRIKTICRKGVKEEHVNPNVNYFSFLCTEPISYIVILKKYQTPYCLFNYALFHGKQNAI